MRAISSRVTATVGATALLVACIGGVGYAANGDNVKVGKSKKGTKITEIKRTKNGPAMKITTKNSSAAPFTTNAKGKVVNLDADKLDGQDPDQIRQGLADVKAIRYKDPNSSRGGNTTYAIGSVPAGTYLVSFNASVLPTTVGTDANPISMTCYLQPSSGGFLGSNVLAQSSVVSIGDFYVAPSFSNVLTFNGNENLLLFCGTISDDGWNANPLLVQGEQPTLTFTKLDGVTDKGMAP